MKVRRLTAEDVHGYLPLSVDFFEDLTFITGLNGSGKTSALRILIALLTPRIEELPRLHFSTAAVTATDGGREVLVRATRSAEGIKLSHSECSTELELSTADLQLMADWGSGSEEGRSPLSEKISTHEVVVAITAMSTPMFLGLDRRFYATALRPGNASVVRRREFVMRTAAYEEGGQRAAATAGLNDVHWLVSQRMQQISAAQEKLDETLRRQILSRAFEYKPGDITLDRLPTRGELDRYRERLADIERAAENLRIPVPELNTALATFFERMTGVVDALEQSTKKSRKKPNEFGKEFFEWIVNRPQADRILEHLRLLDEYSARRAELRAPMERFLSLVNGFLEQTQKRVSLTAGGELEVRLSQANLKRSVLALSSGERQLLVMLAHLSLNPALAKSGVFIVDEPELSLHIDWQERFVDAVREANPDVQLILATHSPAIILDRVDRCRSLS